MSNGIAWFMALALSSSSPDSLLLAEPPRAEAYRSFHPGQPWNDTDGNLIEAHGGGMSSQDGIYYWFGEHRTPGRRRVGVMCCSSRDLYNWN